MNYYNYKVITPYKDGDVVECRIILIDGKFYYTDDPRLGIKKRKEKSGILIDGVVKTYDRYDNLLIEIPYKDGKICGILKKYFDKDKLEYAISYIDDKKNGFEMWFYENGNVKSQTLYVDGEKNAIETLCYKNGNVKSQTPYIDDKKNGIQLEFWENGKIKKAISFVDGKIDEVKNYDKSGKLINDEIEKDELLNFIKHRLK